MNREFADEAEVLPQPPSHDDLPELPMDNVRKPIFNYCFIEFKVWMM